MSRAADTEAAVREASEGQEVNEQESDADSEHFEDASDGAATHHDFDKPDWKEGAGEDEDAKASDVAEEEVKDSAGSVKGSPDYVDEALLEQWAESLGVEELEQKRLEGVGYKLEGNTLYQEGRVLEACDKYTAGLRVCPLQFTQVVLLNLPSCCFYGSCCSFSTCTFVPLLLLTLLPGQGGAVRQQGPDEEGAGAAGAGRQELQQGYRAEPTVSEGAPQEGGGLRGD